MIPNSVDAWTPKQLSEHLTVIDQMLHQHVFNRTAAFTNVTRTLFVGLIPLLGDLLQQSEQAGKRIDFLDEVGTNGKIQDITSLLAAMRRSLYNFAGSVSKDPGLTIVDPAINHFYGAGVGYFANGLFFRCDHDDELAFFVGYDRVFFFRHLVRAFNEAKMYLQATLNSTP